jgi:glycosyltransferase involved in cell wall biosynthesis
LSGRFVISTFGLISRGKGLEYAIQALPPVVEKYPEVLYLILGETHPNVRRHEGESYREELQALVRELGLESHVQFVNRYLTKVELIRYLQATDIYLTPYLNPNQIVSGTLAYAMACGKVIVSTPYLYAQALCADGRGILVNFRDPQSIADALLLLLDNPRLRAEMERRAYAFGRQMTWQAVGKKYAELFVAIAQEYRRPWVFFASTPERRYPTGLTVVEKAGML